MAPIVGHSPTYQSCLVLTLLFLIFFSSDPGCALGISQLRPRTKEATARIPRAAGTEGVLIDNSLYDNDVDAR